MCIREKLHLGWLLLPIVLTICWANAWFKSLLCKSEQCVDESVRWIGYVFECVQVYSCAWFSLISLIVEIMQYVRVCVFARAYAKCNIVKLKNESTYTDVNLSCVRDSLLSLFFSFFCSEESSTGVALQNSFCFCYSKAANEKKIFSICPTNT